MKSPVESVVTHLRSLGIDAEPERFDVEVPTAKAAAAHLGCEVGAIANSLVFAAGDEPVMLLVSGARRADLTKAARLLGVAKLQRATPEMVVEATGQEIGGCAPCGHPRGMRVLVDPSLRAFDLIWAGAGDPTTMVALTFDQLVTASSGTEAEIAESTD